MTLGLEGFISNIFAIEPREYMARASIKRAMTHRQFKWLSFCNTNSYAQINTSKAVNN